MNKFIFLAVFLFCSITSPAQVWWDINYLDCLKNDLPCDCWSKGMKIEIDTAEEIAIIGFYDPAYSKLKKISSRNYITWNDPQSKEINDSLFFYATLGIQNDTLLFYDGFTHFTLVKYETAAGVEELPYLEFVNKALAQRRYNTLQQTLGQDSLSCYCDMDAWLSIVEAGDQHWSIERVNDTVYLYELLNYPDHKVLYYTRNVKTGKTKTLYTLQKKKIAEYSW